MRIRYSFGSRHTGNLTNIKKQRERYPDVADKVVRMSDIILEVLDARFIGETRNIETEKHIKEIGKEIIYVLNKCDLVDRKELNIPSDVFPYVLLSVKKREGGSRLRGLIKMQAKRFFKREKGRKNVYLGVLGYPNTGKSSLINFLTGRAGAKVGAMPGFTKGLQKIRLSAGILLLDTPGVIPKKEYSAEKSKLIEQHAKVGARSYANVRNPEMSVHRLVKEYSQDMEKFYKVDSEGDSEMLIEKVGRKKGMLTKGGVVDEDRAARAILKDWQEGKIRIKQKVILDEEEILKDES